MTPADQEVIEGLLSILENFFAENLAFRGQLRRAWLKGFRDNADRRGVKAVAQTVPKVFGQQCRQAMRSTETWARFVKEYSADPSPVQ